MTVVGLIVLGAVMGLAGLLLALLLIIACAVLHGTQAFVLASVLHLSCMACKHLSKRLSCMACRHIDLGFAYRGLHAEFKRAKTARLTSVCAEWLSVVYHIIYDYYIGTCRLQLCRLEPVHEQARERDLCLDRAGAQPYAADLQEAPALYDA